MSRFFSVLKPGFGVLFLLVAPVFQAQEIMPGLLERAVVLNITTRIAENDLEVWNSINSKVTLPGRPVSIKLLGGNVVMAIQLTPYLRDRDQNILVAQGQIWLDIPNEGLSYKTTMQTIPLKFGEQVYFFPLGSDTLAGNPRIELLIVLQRYEQPAEETEEDTGLLEESPEPGEN
ncbi:MAG: hypothetical protein LBI67_07115 [Treponema sp.]|jgi:hypothetical protein|nr:hypothetical protein [Treponema sp.]